jgi:ribosome-associated translation inhibitor RaiA
MSRYICSYRVKVAPGQLYPLLIEVLESCNFEITYEMHDYLMARENPGKTTFSKLVTVEVLVDSTTATEDEIQVNLVVKNDELPLQRDNHCHQLFALIQQAIAENQQWKLIENVSS